MKRKWMAVTLVFTLLLSTFSVTYVKPRKADAIVQALVPIAGALVAEIALELGYKYVARPAYEAIVKKVSGEIVANSDAYDFPKKKAKKGNGKVEVDVSPNDRAKIAKRLAEEAKNVIDLETVRKGKMSKPSYSVEAVETDPFYKTSLQLDIVPETDISSGYRAVDFVTKLFHVEFKPIAYANKSEITLIDSVTYKRHVLGQYSGSFPSTPPSYSLKVKSVGSGVDTSYLYNPPGTDPRYNTFYLSQSSEVTAKLYNAYVKALEETNSEIFYAEGIIVPKSTQDVYPVPVNTPSSYQLPNANDLKKNLVLDMPDDIPYFEGEIVDVDYDELNNYTTEIEDSYNTYIEYGDVVTTNNYESVTNNYYTYHNYNKTQDEVAGEIQIIIENNNDIDIGTGTCPEGDETCKPAEALDRTLLTYIKETYDYLDDWMDQLVVSSRSVKESAEGLVSFLDEIFDWMPSEWRALFATAFIGGILAHFFRR